MEPSEISTINTSQEHRSSAMKEADLPTNFTYNAPWPVYSLALSNHPDTNFCTALGSFIEDQNNKITILEVDSDRGCFRVKGCVDHTYPPTKLLWMPEMDGTRPNLLGTVGDCFRLWKYDGSLSLVTQLSNTSQSEYPAPITSFDWNSEDLNLIGTSSIDTTCSIWDIEKQSLLAQIIAHDKDVYDIAFAKGVYVFASVGADGSVRQFDLRNLTQSTILYERQDFTPLLRLVWNKQDPNYLATIVMDSSSVTILDIRNSPTPVEELSIHQSCVNSISWAPHSPYHLASAGDDSQVLIWDIENLPVTQPVLAYSAEEAINMMQWPISQPDWLALSYSRTLHLLKI
jgi:WD repeat-containing protein 68